jgi:hypothetical protein
LSGEEEELGGGREGAGGGAEVEHFEDRELRFLRFEGVMWKMGREEEGGGKSGEGCHVGRVEWRYVDGCEPVDETG